MRSFIIFAVLSMPLLVEAAQAQPQSQLKRGAVAGAMNPDVSLDSLFALSQFNRENPLTFDAGHDPRQSGFNIQQIELTLESNVDPYFHANANLVLTPAGIEIEEAYATSLDFPWNLQLKAGQFLSAFGRHNLTHPHSWTLANKPLVLARLFGGDGLRVPGAQLSWLSPLPWFSELIASIQNSNGETANSFNPDGSMRSIGDGIALVRWNNFFAVTEAFSINAGASFMSGRNAQGVGNRTRIVGGDLYLKYRNPDGLSFLGLQIEALQRHYDTVDGVLRDWGWYAELDYRLFAPLERWHVGARYDWVGPKSAPVITSTLDGSDADVARRYRVSPVITFYPSEFSKFRLQYDYDKPEDFVSAQQVVTLQFEYAIGAHGAHTF